MRPAPPRSPAAELLRQLCGGQLSGEGRGAPSEATTPALRPAPPSHGPLGTPPHSPGTDPGPSEDSEVFKRPENRGAGGITSPVLCSGTPFLFPSSPRPYHSFIHLINTHLEISHHVLGILLRVGGNKLNETGGNAAGTHQTRSEAEME